MKRSLAKILKQIHYEDIVTSLSKSEKWSLGTTGKNGAIPKSLTSRKK